MLKSLNVRKGTLLNDQICSSLFHGSIQGRQNDLLLQGTLFHEFICHCYPQAHFGTTCNLLYNLKITCLIYTFVDSAWYYWISLHAMSTFRQKCWVQMAKTSRPSMVCFSSARRASICPFCSLHWACSWSTSSSRFTCSSCSFSFLFASSFFFSDPGEMLRPVTGSPEPPGTPGTRAAAALCLCRTEDRRPVSCKSKSKCHKLCFSLRAWSVQMDTNLFICLLTMSTNRTQPN